MAGECTPALSHYTPTDAASKPVGAFHRNRLKHLDTSNLNITTCKLYDMYESSKMKL